jgi:hypothetical protein
VTEDEIAERIDQTRDERQSEQQRRERTVPAGATGQDDLSEFLDKLVYPRHGRQCPWHTCAKQPAASGRLITFQLVST